jgi:branched-chain amino acid transport system permease protein
MKPHTAPPWIFWTAVAAAVILNAIVLWRNPGDLDRLLINILLAMSAFVTLHARLLSLGSAGFMAIGAYASAILVVKAGWPLWASLPGAVLVCVAVALIIGAPVLKLSDVYLAIATLGFGEVVRIVIILNPDWTGGPTGANLSTGFGYELMKQTQTWMLIAALVVAASFFYRIQRSKAGRAFRAIRENPSAAATMGVNVVAYRRLAFVLGAALAGTAGVFYAHAVGSLDNTDFRFTRAVDVLSFAVLGGAGHWLGPILGAAVLTALPSILRDVVGASFEFLRTFVQLPNILDGAAIMLAIVFLPGGFMAALPRKIRAVTGAGRHSGNVPANNGALLTVDQVTRRFSGLNALSNVSFELVSGRTYGLIGPNGAGKTTLINVMTGLYRPSMGSIRWKGRPLGHAVHKIAASGIARTYQHIQLFGEMTVLENVVVGRHTRIRTNLLTAWLNLPRERHEEIRAKEEALALLQRLGLGAFASTPAGQLSYGDQRRVEIARALATEPELLLLDEPAAGMNDSETKVLAEFLLELKKTGLTMVVIEHHLDLITAVSDELIVLNFGQKIAQGQPDVVSRNPAVIEAYLGSD